MSEEKNNKKDLQVVEGDGNNLDISPVYEHLPYSKPKTKDEKPKNIVIPKPVKKEQNNQSDSTLEKKDIEDNKENND